jgi:hypothetical protein
VKCSLTLILTCSGESGTKSDDTVYHVVRACPIVAIASVNKYAPLVFCYFLTSTTIRLFNTLLLHIALEIQHSAIGLISLISLLLRKNIKREYLWVLKKGSDYCLQSRMDNEYIKTQTEPLT